MRGAAAPTSPKRGRPTMSVMPRSADQMRIYQARMAASIERPAGEGIPRPWVD